MVSLRAEGLRFAFGEGREIIAGLDLEVRGGELAALVGPNGAGKTTLLKVLAGLNAPSEGRVLEDADVTRMNARARARRIAVVPQDGRSLQGTSLFEFVLGGRYAWRRPWSAVEDDDRARVEEALRSAELEDRRNDAIDDLSGGERQRAFFARALAQDADFMLVDEPTAALDPRHQLWVFDRLAEQAERGRGILVVTHDLNLASQYADRLQLLVNGRIVAAGAAAEVLEAGVLSELYGSDFLVGEEISARFGEPRPFILPWRRGR